MDKIKDVTNYYYIIYNSDIFSKTHIDEEAKPYVINKQED